MPLNVMKTKLMMFGENSENVEVRLNGCLIENVKSIKYLGVILDPLLDFGMQVDYAVGKAKRAAAKVSTLIDGRQGIPVNIGLNLYKTLVRPHMEYAFPVWANIRDSEVEQLEKVQIQSLRRIIGAKAHSSSMAVEVVSGVLPVRQRKRELCCREYLRIITKEDCHQLVQMMSSSKRAGVRFCPMQYINIMSRELQKAIEGCRLKVHKSTTVRDSRQLTSIASLDICKSSHGNIRPQQTVQKFMEQHSESSVLIFTDGSVCNGPVGSGACAAVVFPIGANEEIFANTSAVGTKVNSLVCEMNGIILGLEMGIKCIHDCKDKKQIKSIYVFSDCVSAINTVVSNSELNRYPDVHQKLQNLQCQLSDISVMVNLVNIPGHSGILGNEMADRKAKEAARMISVGLMSAPSEISLNDARRISEDIAQKSWQRKWNEENTGRYTYNLIPKVGTKVIFPQERDIGVSYSRMLLHDTMLKEDSHRTGTSDSAACECGTESESTEHFLLRCPLHEEARISMIEHIKEVWNTSKSTKKQQWKLTEELLLAPTLDENCSKKVDREIKEAVFRFLATVNRKL